MSNARGDKVRWVVNNVDPITVEVIKSLAATSRQSMGLTLDQAVEYFTRHINISKEGPLKWSLPDDF